MSLPVVVSALLPACAAAGGRCDAARSAPAPARPSAAGRRVLLRAGPNPFSTEPGAWSSAFEKRDDSKPKKSSGGVATAPAEKLAPGEVPDVPLTSEVRSRRSTAPAPAPRRSAGARLHDSRHGRFMGANARSEAPPRRAAQPCSPEPCVSACG
jgi:hypothetical protein